jgi:hypothetical protein
MPTRHAQRLRNLAASPDARQRLADNPVFSPVFSDVQRRPRTARQGDSAHRPEFSDRRGGGRDE